MGKHDFLNIASDYTVMNASKTQILYPSHDTYSLFELAPWAANNAFVSRHWALKKKSISALFVLHSESYKWSAGSHLRRGKGGSTRLWLVTIALVASS